VRISYRNSVRPFVCLFGCSVTTRYQFKPGLDRDFGISPYGSVLSIVFLRQNFLTLVTTFLPNEIVSHGLTVTPYEIVFNQKREPFWTEKVRSEKSCPLELWRSVNELMGRGYKSGQFDHYCR